MGKMFDNLAAQSTKAGEDNLAEQLRARARKEKEADAAPVEPRPQKPKVKAKGGRPVQTPGLKHHSIQFTDEEWDKIATKARHRAFQLGFQVPSKASLMRAAVRAFASVTDEEGLKTAMREVDVIEEIG
ncbi:MAG: hypothetical protein A2341_28160 [Deltaproteobacteria bacterium RIFOXYB12_FULL_58_9]|nr:MAG: hypothetical protein A2341_28160 [Deltaproteobacteria bacterium RIFOXYB12_FULL_58_9]